VLFLVLAAALLGLHTMQSARTAAALATATEMQMLSQRLARTSALVVQGSPAALDPLRDSFDRFRYDLEVLTNGGTARGVSLEVPQEAPIRAALAQVSQRWEPVDSAVNRILANAVSLGGASPTTEANRGPAGVADALEAARLIAQQSEPLLADTIRLAEAVEQNGRSVGASVWGAVATGLLALGCLVLLGKLFLDDARSRAGESERENRRNQEAILRLLNEMGNLADGDLTVQASVTEDITGAIADSINFTIEELRSLVKGINDATDQVTKATADAQAISVRLFESSQRQNREIQQASASVLAMAQSINEVSSSAAQSAKVAQVSLAAAEKGGRAVQNQIAGMDEIRAQIQDTAKRIKRLGESSLEIGEIVELISDITEQTNVLALNAAIQAASAGEAGRGFAVVAEEVQRLAERSGEATKQIEAIVKMIQADTQDAIAAMERSTEGVVDGTKLSDAAGQALEEIRQVSRQLAELIGGISGQTQKQTASVSEVTRGMQGILRITEETSEGTKQTNVSIGQLGRLAASLRSSVAGFKV
jgi:twitching motility protein PilJ